MIGKHFGSFTYPYTGRFVAIVFSFTIPDNAKQFYAKLFSEAVKNHANIIFIGLGSETASADVRDLFTIWRKVVGNWRSRTEPRPRPMIVLVVSNYRMDRDIILPIGKVMILMSGEVSIYVVLQNMSQYIGRALARSNIPVVVTMAESVIRPRSSMKLMLDEHKANGGKCFVLDAEVEECETVSSEDLNAVKKIVSFTVR